jgi:AraC family transcriptional regulator
MSTIAKTIFASELLQVGVFRCPPAYPRFCDTGPATGHWLVFPRTSVRITHAGGEPIIADPNSVLFYNRAQEYRRAPLSDRGDLCEWFDFAPAVVATALQLYDPVAADRPDRPFRFTHTPSDARVYLRQRLVVEHLLNSQPPDQLFVEEALLGVLDAMLRQAYQVRGVYPQALRLTSQQRAREVSGAVQEVLNLRFQEEISLSQLARAVFSSPYQLCRTFRQQTGYTIHQYLNQLRLRTALEAVADGADDLTALALDLGYASHSHFTQAFRQSFGLPPSHLRNFLPLAPQLRKNLIA